MEGDKFYIVLDGNLEVWTPNNIMKSLEDGTKKIYENKIQSLNEYIK